MIIRIFIYALIIYLVYRIVKVLLQIKKPRPDDKISRGNPVSTASEELVEDLQCHTYVPQSQAIRKEISGINYYFCSNKCAEEYIIKRSN